MTYRFDVPGMKCRGCVRKIEGAVRRKDASAEIRTDVENRIVMVNSSVSREKFAAAIHEAGYATQMAL